MTGVSFKLTKNFSIDLNMFHFYRTFDDGVEFLRFEVNWDRYKGDHKPSFKIFFSLINFVIFELDIYNIHHVPID